MKQHTIKLSSALLLSSLFLVGCGETVVIDDTAPQAHQTIKQTKFQGTLENTEWTSYVDITASLDTNTSATDTFTLTTNFTKAVPAQVNHFQYFVDVDGLESTGFTYGEDSWRISGADYLIEDGDLYQSMSSTQWAWKYIGSFENIAYTNYNKIVFTSTNPEITAMINKNYAGSIHVSMEVFNADWSSSYDTISTRAVIIGGNTGSTQHPDSNTTQVPNNGTGGTPDNGSGQTIPGGGEGQTPDNGVGGDHPGGGAAQNPDNGAGQNIPGGGVAQNPDNAAGGDHPGGGAIQNPGDNAGQNHPGA